MYYAVRGGMKMRFSVPVAEPTTNKCVRFPNDVIEGVERAIAGRQTTFSAFTVAAVRAALASLEEEMPGAPERDAEE